MPCGPWPPGGSTTLRLSAARAPWGGSLRAPGEGVGGDPTTHHRHHHLGLLTAAQEALWGGWHPRKLPVLKVWPSNVVSSPSQEHPKWIPRAEPL